MDGVRGWEGIVRARLQSRWNGDVPSRVSYVERIGKRWTIDAERLGARSLGEVREGGSEVLQQLFIRLLRIGPGRQVSNMYQSYVGHARSAQHNTWRSARARARVGGGTYRLRNIAEEL